MKEGFAHVLFYPDKIEQELTPILAYLKISDENFPSKFI